MSGFFKWASHRAASERHEVGNNVPDDIRDAIDRVAEFVARCEQAMMGTYYPLSQVGRDASTLVVWAFKDRRRDSRFVAFLENRVVGVDDELD